MFRKRLAFEPPLLLDSPEAMATQASTASWLLMNKLESALDEGSNVPHSSQTRLEWATLQFLESDQSPLRRICSLPASRKAEGGPLKRRLA